MEDLLRSLRLFMTRDIPCAPVVVLLAIDDHNCTRVRVKQLDIGFASIGNDKYHKRID